MVVRVLLIILISSLFSSSIKAESDWEFLPKGSHFKPITLDPATPQLGASINSYFLEGTLQRKAYIPVLIGTDKIFLRKELDKNSLELGFEYGVYSQFIFSTIRSMVMGGLENADYRVSAIANLKTPNSILRFKLFHQSSHLGDDHIIRNEITTPTSNTQNYEELSVMYLKELESLRYYLSGGLNVGYYTIRGRILIQGGFDFDHPVGNSGWISYIGGTDIKIYQHNDFTPNWKFGLGLKIGGDRANALKIMFEYYNGHLPYSTYEFERVQLFGVGIYLNPSIKIDN